LNRRTFLGSLVALAAAPASVLKPQVIGHHWYEDRTTGISIRFIRQWDPAKATRMSMLEFRRDAFALACAGLPMPTRRIDA
jgi:hypothetical protein